MHARPACPPCWCAFAQSALEAGAQIIQRLEGGGCGQYSCGMGVPAGTSTGFRSFGAFKSAMGRAGVVRITTDEAGAVWVGGDVAGCVTGMVEI